MDPEITVESLEVAVRSEYSAQILSTIVWVKLLPSFPFKDCPSLMALHVTTASLGWGLFVSHDMSGEQCLHQWFTITARLRS